MHEPREPLPDDPVSSPRPRLRDQETDWLFDDDPDARREADVGEPGAPESWKPEARRFPAWLVIGLLALGIVLLAAGSSVFFGSRGDKVYGARVDILYAASDNTSDDSRERILATQQELLRSRVVLENVAGSTNIPLDELQSGLAIEVGRDDLLHLTFGDESPERARLVAQTVAQTYIELAGRLSSESDSGQRLIQKEIDRLEAGAKPLSSTTSSRIARLQDRLLDLAVQRVTQPEAELLSPAYVLDKPLSPDPIRSLALGLVIGLLLATAVVVALLRRRATVRQ